MDFHHLKVFLAAARHLNYTRAGEQLRLQQPTVSAHIKQLEAELGVQLFERVGNRLTLTEAGRLLEPIARRALLALEEVHVAVDEYRGLGRGSLHLGASTTPGLYILPRLLTRFRRLHPNIALRLTIANTEAVERMVSSGEVDFGFVGKHLIAKEIVSRSWLEDRIVLIAPPDHRFARRRRVEIGSLANEPLIEREAGSATRAIIEKALESHDCAPTRIIELGHPEAIKEAVMSGMGIAFISRFAVEREARSGVMAIIPVAGFSLKRELHICYRQDKHLSKADTALMAEAAAIE